MIKLTPLQAEHIEWALDPMQEYWGGWDGKPTREGEMFSEAGDPDLEIPDGAIMPILDGDMLAISNWDQINDDLLYRIGEMLPGMIEDNTEFSPQQISGQKRSCEMLAEKIEAEIAGKES